MRVRIILAVLITLVLVPGLPFNESIEPFSPTGLLTALQQVSVGIVMGLILQIVFSALIMAGQAMATTMGLGFASSVDPQNGVQVTMLGQLYLILGTLYFLAMDGHLLLLQVVADGFTLPARGVRHSMAPRSLATSRCLQLSCSWQRSWLHYR